MAGVAAEVPAGAVRRPVEGRPGLGRGRCPEQTLAQRRAHEGIPVDSHAAGLPFQSSARFKPGSEADQPGARFQRQRPPGN
jgi:hypothetical protein